MSFSTRRRASRGAATAEYAVGVVAAVLVAALLLQLVLDGFFEGLLRSLFVRVLDALESLLFTGAAAFSWTGIATRAWSMLAGAAASPLGWAGTVADAATGALRWVGGPLSKVLP